MNIYIVTNGEYSDYRIIAVFLDEEKAEELRKEINADKVEVWKTGEEKLTIKWWIRMNRNGDVTTIYFSELSEKKPRDLDIVHIHNILSLSGHVWAETKEKAIKITNDHRRQLIAEGKL